MRLRCDHCATAFVPGIDGVGGKSLKCVAFLFGPGIPFGREIGVRGVRAVPVSQDGLGVCYYREQFGVEQLADGNPTTGGELQREIRAQGPAGITAGIEASSCKILGDVPGPGINGQPGPVFDEFELFGFVTMPPDTGRHHIPSHQTL